MQKRPTSAAPASVITRLGQATPTYVMEYKFYFVMDGDMFKPAPKKVDEDEDDLPRLSSMQRLRPTSSGMLVNGEESATNEVVEKEEETLAPGFKAVPHELPLPRLRHLSPQTYGSPPATSNPGSGAVGEYIPKQSILPLPNFLPSLPSLLDSPSRKGKVTSLSSAVPNNEEYADDREERAAKRFRSGSGGDRETMHPPTSTSNSKSLDVESERQMAALNLVTLQQHGTRR